MITVMSKKRKKELEECEKRLANLTNNIGEAHRWLSQYDWFLNPMWKYLFEAKTFINSARDEMNKAFLNYISTVEKLAVEKHQKESTVKTVKKLAKKRSSKKKNAKS